MEITLITAIQWPWAPAPHAEQRNQKGHDDGNQRARNHGSTGAGKHGQRIPLFCIPGRQRHHQGMAQVVDRVGKGEKQVVADHNPGHLHRHRCPGHRIQQASGHGNQTAGDQQPGSRLSLPGAGMIDESADQKVHDHVHCLGQKRHQREKDTGKPQHISVKLGQVSAAHPGIDHGGQTGPQEIAQPFLLFCCTVRMNFRVKPAGREDFFYFCWHNASPISAFYNFATFLLLSDLMIAPFCQSIVKTILLKYQIKNSII